MEVAGIEIELVQKDIKNLHLAVYPPDGRVRLAAPHDVNQKTLELYVISKIHWIKKQQRRFLKMDRQSPRQYVDRESHFFLGKRYLLRVKPLDAIHLHPQVVCKTKTYLDLFIKNDSSVDHKAAVLKEWYRDQLKAVLEELVPKWERILGVKANLVKVHTMRTKWGSCNTENANILINIELAKKSIESIEYVVAHELIHLIERNHNDNFKAHLDKFLPNWKKIREELNMN
jgi:predicted metal-dependent hydrolase